jgi:hypothetical protein
MCRRSILLTEGGDGVGVKSYDRKKAWPSINHSVLSARDTLDDVPLVPPMVFYPQTPGPQDGGFTAGSLSVVDSESLPDPFKKPAPWPLTPRPSNTPVKANNFEFAPVDNTGLSSVHLGWKAERRWRLPIEHTIRMQIRNQSIADSEQMKPGFAKPVSRLCWIRMNAQGIDIKKLKNVTV